ncbi:MAG: outer membrane protein assembly factor BamB [Chthoniobacter sp.]|nr:outer membrane protein assembly factor BamB [Chthoniobacter sp.]
MLAAIGIGAIRWQSELDRNYRAWSSTAVLLLAVLLVMIWFVFLSRIRWRIRLVALGLIALAGFAGTRLLTVDGSTDGTGLPKLAWKWSPKRGVPFFPQTASATPVTAAAALPEVPQFFGPNRDGTVNGAALARDWTETLPRLLWRQPIGLGWSSFAVAGGRSFTQEQRGDQEFVTCYDALTGKLLWTHANAVGFSQWQGGGGPRATPTIVGSRVFAIGATGILDCLEAASGQLVWSRDVLKENQLANLIWGVSASPLVFDDTVVVTGGLTNGPTVLAYRAATGEPLWRAGHDKASYASPLLAMLAGQRVVLSLNASSLTAHDPATGAVLLDHPWADEKTPRAAQPVALAGDRVFLSSGYGIGCVLLQIKAGADGKLTAAELWKTRNMKNQFNSVAAREGFLYGLDDGLLACVEIATGQRKWKDGRFGSGQTLLVDDLVLIQSEAGPVVLAEAKPEGFRELGRFPALSSKTWNHPTLAGRYLLVRNDQEAACYELPLQSATVSR